jgi:meso-butanediol dehydrogenase/(S,S)-butanediol dehydrogenase/diacetyl reductase
MTRIVYVTGAASGIGFAVARRFATEGASLALADLDRDRLEHARRSLTDEFGVTVYTHAGDLGEDETAARFVEGATAAVGPAQVLVNSVGIARMGSILQTTIEEWDLVFRTNVRSVFLACKAVLPGMVQSGAGAIVNIASEAGMVGFVDYAAYSASKAAVVNLTRSMAMDHAPAGIRVNAVCPGSIETPLLREFFEAAEDPLEARRLDEKVHPLGIGQPEDIAAAVYYLASDDASYVTGHALLVDGGYTAQ